jgi:hypothetical protein
MTPKKEKKTPNTEGGQTVNNNAPVFTQIIVQTLIGDIHTGKSGINELPKEIIDSLDPKQVKIFEGLALIGDEISVFYLHGVEIYKNVGLSTKGYLLAHFAREIDGSLKDVFFVREEKIKCLICGVEQQDENEPLIGIFRFLNIPKESDFALEWVKITNNLLAHSTRQGAYSQHRKPAEAQQLWDAYENILYTLVGNHFALTERVKNLIQNEIPTIEILSTLPNLFKDDKLKFVFYTNLKSLFWLKLLYENNFFEVSASLNEFPTPEKEGYLTIPAWYEGRYIEYVAIQNAKGFDDDISFHLGKIIDNYIDSKEKNEIINRNADSSIFISILYLPANRITDIHLEFAFSVIRQDFSYFSNKLIKKGLPNFIEQDAKDIILKVLKIMFTPQKLKREHNSNVNDFNIKSDYQLPIYEFWLFREFKEMIPALAQLLGNEAILLFENIFLPFKKNQQNFFNTILIENVDYSYKEPYTNKSFYALVNSTTQFLLSTNENITDILKKWVNSEVVILRRIAIYAIAKKHELHKNIFWTLKYNPFNHSGLNIEIAQFIRMNLDKFSDREIKKMVTWIEKIKKKLRFSDDSEEDRIKYNAYEIRRRLLLLKDTNNDLVLRKIKEYEEIENTPIKANESFKPLTVSITGGLEYPSSSKNIEDKTIDELIDYINNFNEQDKHDRRINYEGLGEVLKNIFTKEPDRYFPHLPSFKNLDVILVYKIADCVSKKVETGEFKYWNEFLVFYEQAILNEQFWQHEWTQSALNSFGWLIKHNIRKDDDRIPIVVLPTIKNILLALLQKIDKQDRTYDDLSMMVANNPQCVILASLLEYSIRISLKKPKNEQVKWEDDVKVVFTKMLKDTPSVQLYAVIGMYLPELEYLDKSWVADNLDLILPDNQQYWEACFSMYLISHNQTYSGVYTLLKEKGHYIKALNFGNFKSEVSKRLIGHICLEFDWNPQNLNDDNSLMRLLLEQENVDNLSKVVDTFWQWERKSKQNEAKIKKLWKLILTICKENIEQDGFKKLAGKLCYWIRLLEKIGDKSFGRIKFSLAYLENTMFLFDDLLVHVKKTPEIVGTLLLAYAEHKEPSTWTYTPDKLKSIVEYLYQIGYKDLANDVCDVYGKLGFDLGDIYTANNDFK